MTTSLRARLKYPIGSAWRIRDGLDYPYDGIAGYKVVVTDHDLDSFGGVSRVGVEFQEGFQWWAVETADVLLEPDTEKEDTTK